MHMAFLSRVFKNLQWYGMTSKNPVVSMTTGFSFCLFGEVFPLVFPYESEKNSFFTTRHAFNEVIHAF